MTATAQRDQFIAELDLVLAALRRVIVRALDSGHGPVSEPPATLPADEVKPEPFTSGNGIDVNLVGLTVLHRGLVAVVSRRQAQLVSVLVRASPHYVNRSHAIVRAWPDLLSESREATVAPSIAALTARLAPLGLIVECVKGYGLRIRVAETEGSA